MAMEAEWISALAGGRAPFLDLFSSFVRVCVLLRMTRRRRLSEDGIKVSPPSPVQAVRLTSLVCVWRCVSGRSIFGGFARISSLFVYVRVSSVWILPVYVIFHRRRLLFWVLVLWGLSTTTSRLSTTISCARLRRWRGDDGGAPSARFSACSRR